MNLQVTGHHVEVTPALREYVETKISPVVQHFDHITKANVILSIEKHQQKAEATLHVPGKEIFVENAHEDLYAAIDLMFDKLDRQVQKHKQKLQDHHRQDKRAAMQGV